MELILTNKELSLRPIKEGDNSVLCKIYGSTREKELSRINYWSDYQKQSFIEQQFLAQHEYYQKNYVGASFFIIQKKEEVIGRLYIQENYKGQSIRIIDISLLPKWRNLRIGSGILKDIMESADELKLPVSIHVESFNPAKKLYEKLGFSKVSETNGVYHLMEWKPEEFKFA